MRKSQREQFPKVEDALQTTCESLLFDLSGFSCHIFISTAPNDWLSCRDGYDPDAAWRGLKSQKSRRLPAGGAGRPSAGAGVGPPISPTFNLDTFDRDAGSLLSVTVVRIGVNTDRVTQGLVVYDIAKLGWEVVEAFSFDALEESFDGEGTKGFGKAGGALWVLSRYYCAVFDSDCVGSTCGLGKGIAYNDGSVAQGASGLPTCMRYLEIRRSATGIGEAWVAKEQPHGQDDRSSDERSCQERDAGSHAFHRAHERWHSSFGTAQRLALPAGGRVWILLGSRKNPKPE